MATVREHEGGADSNIHGNGGLCRACPSTGLSLVPEASFAGGPVLARGATLGPKGLCRGVRRTGAQCAKECPRPRPTPADGERKVGRVSTGACPEGPRDAVPRRPNGWACPTRGMSQAYPTGRHTNHEYFERCEAWRDRQPRGPLYHPRNSLPAVRRGTRRGETKRPKGADYMVLAPSSPARRKRRGTSLGEVRREPA